MKLDQCRRRYTAIRCADRSIRSSIAVSLRWLSTSLLIILALLRCAAPYPAPSAAPSNTVHPPERDEFCLAGSQAPEVYRAKITTSRGPVTIEVHRAWAPSAADHFYELVCAQFYSQARFYRVVKGFVVQFGMNADPAVHAVWQKKTLKDEPARTSNKRGTVCFTGSAARDSRTTHVFINLADNAFLGEGSAPFGFVSSGMEVVDSLYDRYGEHTPNGNGPDQERLWRDGNRYLLSEFPNLDYIVDIQIER